MRGNSAVGTKSACVAVIGVAMNVLAGFAAPANAATFSLLYSFQHNGTDGNNPGASLINVNGILYGTTLFGGGTSDSGTVFSIKLKTGAETVPYSFTGTNGDANPQASLINVKGMLYGTDIGGDQSGTVFSFDPKTGTETVLHSFTGGSDGLVPLAGLISVGHTLYGTTQQGGGNGGGSGDGTVFSIDLKTNTYTVLYSFCSQQNGSNCFDGSGPVAGLIHYGYGGNFYGTTATGGASNLGTIFALNPKTGFQSLYSFQGVNGSSGPDGALPEASLINVNGTLYGTTQYGGSGSCAGHGTIPAGCGSVFSYNVRTNTYTVLYSFKGGTADGAEPIASLIDLKGTLYGTTQYGGTGPCKEGFGIPAGCGTIFAYNIKTGTETVLYSFTGGADGAVPEASLINVAGTLYGTTSGYGFGIQCSSGSPDCGSVFSIKP